MASVISQRRRAAGLSQQQLAVLAGCSIQMVQALEQGRRRPSRSDVLPRITAVLDDHEAQILTSGPAPTDPIGDAG